MSRSKRLWQRLRQWWRRGHRSTQRQTTIRYRAHDGSVHAGQIEGFVGMYLRIRSHGPNGLEQRLVSEYDAEDPDTFWQQWHAWGGEAIFFDDGSRYR